MIFLLVFFRKKLFTLKSDCGLIFQVQFISFVKRKANFTIGRQKCKGPEKPIKVLPIDPVFKQA